ncbi:MAG: HYR domain-containing protein [Chloroflexi bacterium]|nr:HYR domain-containing protein [Chloroflexota bacterium]
MKRVKSIRTLRTQLATTLAVSLSLLSVAPVLADQQVVDNDLLTSGNQNIVNLSAPPGAVVNTSGQIVIQYQGGNHLAAGTVVTLVADATQTTLPAGYSVASVSLTIPTPWASNVTQPAGTSAVSFTAPITPGSYSYTVKWKSTVDYGNKLTGAPALTINLVVTAPVIPLSLTAPADVTVEGNTTGGATGVALGTAVASGGTPPYTITNNAPALFPLGTTTVTWTVTDASSNTATDTQKVTVVDTTPPSIAAPADKTVEGNTTGGATGVALGSPTVSDIVDPSPAVTNNAPAFFPLGTTTVTWTAKDASGNTATATQKVTVVDTTPPTIIAVASLTVIVGAPSSALPAPAVTDIVDPNPTVTNNAPAFFPVGVTVVTWTATDASGNSATATTTVTAVYNFGGFLQPIPPPVSTFKAGSTIPVKFTLTDYNGNSVSTATGTASINTSTAASAAIRYDPTAQQYIANLKTPKEAAPGSYTITVSLNDGSTHSVVVTLK